MQLRHGVHDGVVFSAAGAVPVRNARPTVAFESDALSIVPCVTAPAGSEFSLTSGALVEKPSSVLRPHTSWICGSVGAAQSASARGLNVFGFGSFTFLAAGSRRM